MDKREEAGKRKRERTEVNWTHTGEGGEKREKTGEQRERRRKVPKQALTDRLVNESSWNGHSFSPQPSPPMLGYAHSLMFPRTKFYDSDASLRQPPSPLPSVPPRRKVVIEERYWKCQNRRFRKSHSSGLQLLSFYECLIQINALRIYVIGMVLLETCKPFVMIFFFFFLLHFLYNKLIGSLMIVILKGGASNSVVFTSSYINRGHKFLKINWWNAMALL